MSARVDDGGGRLGIVARADVYAVADLYYRGFCMLLIVLTATSALRHAASWTNTAWLLGFVVANEVASRLTWRFPRQVRAIEWTRVYLVNGAFCVGMYLGMDGAFAHLWEVFFIPMTASAFVGVLLPKPKPASLGLLFWPAALAVAEFARHGDPVRTLVHVGATAMVGLTLRQITIALSNSIIMSDQRAVALRELGDDLERRVADRTTELTRANDELLREVTEHARAQASLRNAEEQLRHADKMNAIGKLAGGIAHDFNNILTVILLNARAGGARDEADEATRASFAEIETASQRAAELTRQLLAFSRQQVLAPTVTDLDAVLDGMGSMLRRLLGEDVALRVIRAPDPWKIRADRGQLERVVMNLVVNARDAMPAGGTLTLETRNLDVDEARRDVPVDIKPGPYVMLAVSDTGTGIDDATLARIFEPFFTTKELGQGTGLGLSTVFGIVKQSGGHVWATSEPGVGTTFQVLLPRTDDAPRVVTATPPALRPRSASETVLLVEDDGSVRDLVAGIVRDAGYDVLVASDGAAALELLARRTAPLHALLTDVVMPQMSGRELADRVKASCGAVPVVFMSGYTDDVVLQHGVQDSTVDFVPKPIVAEALLRTLREVLDRSP